MFSANPDGLVLMSLNQYSKKQKVGLDLRMHIDEFCDGGGGQLAAEMKVTTADHAYHTNEDAREQMNKSSVNTGFSEGTPYSGLRMADFNHMIDRGYQWVPLTSILS